MSFVVTKTTCRLFPFTIITSAIFSLSSFHNSISQMGSSKLKNLTLQRLLSTSISLKTRAPCRFTDASSTGTSSRAIEPTSFLPKFTFFPYPNFNLVRLWRLQNGPLTFGVRFCSEIVRLDENYDGFRTEFEVQGKEDDVEKVYRTIMDNSHAYSNMGEALNSIDFGLTTELVAGILQRLRFEEKLAFRFFTWAGHQENYAHESRVYNDMIEILSSTKYKIKQFRIVCDMLEYMRRHDKKAVPFEVLLTILRKYCEKYLTHVQKFAKKKRIRVKTQPEINAFNLLLDSMCKCSLVEDAEGMCKRVKKKVKPDANTYNILFFGWCRVRNPIRAMKVLEEMIEMGFTPDNFTYNAAIDAFCRAEMVTEAVELFEFMRTKGSTMSSPTAKTYAIVVVALVKNDRLEECFKFLGHMISSGCLPDVSTYKELIEGMCLAGKVEMAYKFLQEMGSKGYPPDIVTYNCFLKVLCENKHSEEALRLIEVMIKSGCPPSVQSYNMLISMFFEMGDPDGAIETWHEMGKRGCAQDTDTYCVMIEGLFSCHKDEDACCLLEDVVNKGIKLPYRMFDSFLMQLSVIGDLRAIHRLSEHMRKFYNPAMARRFALNEKRKSTSLRGKN